MTLIFRYNNDVHIDNDVYDVNNNDVHNLWQLIFHSLISDTREQLSAVKPFSEKNRGKI